MEELGLFWTNVNRACGFVHIGTVVKLSLSATFKHVNHTSISVQHIHTCKITISRNIVNLDNTS